MLLIKFFFFLHILSENNHLSFFGKIEGNSSSNSINKMEENILNTLIRIESLF